MQCPNYGLELFSRTSESCLTYGAECLNCGKPNRWVRVRRANRAEFRGVHLKTEEIANQRTGLQAEAAEVEERLGWTQEREHTRFKLVISIN